jgi:hypothetical protein
LREEEGVIFEDEAVAFEEEAVPFVDEGEGVATSKYTKITHILSLNMTT